MDLDADMAQLSADATAICSAEDMRSFLIALLQLLHLDPKHGVIDPVEAISTN